ncbi:MAG: RHS repeat-associated core domain-containing protein [Phycisphaerales bacterium]
MKTRPQYTSVFDAIGNRTQAKVTEPGNSSLDRVWDYTVDKLNRYTSVDGPRRLDLMGYTTSGAASLVYTGAASPGLSGTLQPSSTAGPFFRVLPDWSGTGIVAEVGTLNSVDKSLYLPPKPETLSYDADGNLTGDGRFAYTYDGENRLIRVEKAVGIPVAPGLGIDGVWYYEYDYLGRRIRKLRRTIVIEEMMTMNKASGEGGNEGGGETNSLGGGGEMGEMGPIVEELRFMYDGWVLMEELSGTNAVVRSYVHGPDLSASLGGAGGIGGTAFQVNAATASSTNTRWFTFDPQGNVTDLREVAANTRWASVEYGPFGEPTIAPGTNGGQFKLRFSSKYFDEETGFSDFGKRYYNSSTGRWINRDPAQESIGGANLFAYVDNYPTASFDPVGLSGRSSSGTGRLDLGSVDELKRGGGCSYIFTIKVDAVGFDYSSSSGLVTSIAKNQSGLVGHTWVRLEGNGQVIEGGHSGETGDASRDPSITHKDFLTFNGGVVALAAMSPGAARPMAIKEADPANPLRWLRYIYEDGHWAPGAGGHTKVTSECSWSISKSEYEATKRRIDELRASGGSGLKKYGLTGMQCTSTAAKIAQYAGVFVDPYTTLTFPSSMSLAGQSVRLWSDAQYSTLRFALPDKMQDVMSSAGGGKKKVCK